MIEVLKPCLTVYKYSVPISNYGYLGYVLIEDLFGASGLMDMMLFCLPFGIYTNSFGYSILTGICRHL